MLYSVRGRDVLRTDYSYDGDNLVGVKIWENTAPAGSPANWGSKPISASLFTFYPGTDKARHVIQPAQYRQMLNNGIDPETATESQLNEYAITEWQYGSNGRVSVMWTNGRRYQFRFSYAFSGYSGTSFNAWASRTDIVQPDGSLQSLYYSRYGQLILKKVVDSAVTPTKTWYPLYQKFEEGSARIILSAGDDAIGTVNESLSQLVTLNASQGKITQFTYTANGDLETVKIRKGTSGALVPQSLMTYTERNVAGVGKIFVPASQTVYRDESGAQPITTSYTYTWHSGTLQMATKTTTLPFVSTADNGRGITYTRVSHYNLRGELVKSVDERGTATTYLYDTVLAGLIRTIEDEGTGKLNLQTDYVLDDRARTILTLGPAHEIDLDGSPTLIRTARWTYYQDAEDGQWSFSGYRTATGVPFDRIVGPVTITRPNLAPPPGYEGWRQSTQIDAVYSGEGIPAPGTVFDRSTWVRWSLSLMDRTSQTKEQWTYFNIPEEGYGAQSENYGRKFFSYDSAGRQNQTMCAGGTIDRTTFNAMGWPVTEELGTLEGLTVTERKEYDDNGNLTKVTRPVDANPTKDRIATYGYDWRNRLTSSTSVVEQSAGSSSTWTLIATSVYNNLNQVLSSTSYHTSAVDGNRMSHQTSQYDVLGRTFRSEVYAVSATGVISNPQVSNTYYDPTGQVARSAPAGSKLFGATVYDAVGRAIKSCQAYEPSGYVAGSDPASVATAIVITQQEMTWDAAGNMLSSTTRQRFDDATGNGELKDPATQPKARVSYMASYSDAIGRNVSSADYGTNGALPWSRPTVAPLSSDTVLVATTTYDAAGNAVEQTDPMGQKTLRTLDNADRLIATAENSSGGPGETRTTRYEYTDDGWLTRLISSNPATGEQVTQWLRGVTPAQGSALYSNRLVYQKVYPDSSDAGDCITYLYNRQLQVTGMTDQAGTAHSYGYDKLGRALTDTVSFPAGTNVDKTVGKLETVYSQRGLPLRITSYNTAGTTVLNQVLREYNGFNQMVTEYQEHAGAVNTSTSLKVQYSYANGSENTVRPTGITNPDGSSIATAYTSTMANALSRPDEVKEGASILASYQYLGLGTVTELKYNAAASALLTMKGGGTGEAGDPYTGLDRFGRLAATLWKKGSEQLVHTNYGRNRNGGVTWQRNVKAHALSIATEDNFYWYDGLNQVTRHDRGDLAPSSGAPYTGINPATRQQQEIFTFDETGNWQGDYSQSPALSQGRTHNAANQITAIAGPTGAIQPAYDEVGNMTTMPKAGSWTTANTLKWDAWNRLVKLTEGGSHIIYAYDALTRRVSKTSSGESRRYYYDRQWRCVEERVSNAVKAQYVWSPLDRWTMIRRKRSTTGTLNETRFVLKDYLDPTAIIDTTGTVTERYRYDAFGPVKILTPNFSARSTSECNWNFLFHAEFLDEDSGLYNYGYRVYHPELGRWPSRDPLRERGGFNLIKFVTNSPTGWIDFLGREPVSTVGGMPPGGGGPGPTIRLPGQPGYIPWPDDDYDPEKNNCASLAFCDSDPHEEWEVDEELKDCEEIDCSSDCPSGKRKINKSQVRAKYVMTDPELGDKVVGEADEMHVSAGSGITPQQFGPGPVVGRPAIPNVGDTFPTRFPKGHPRRDTADKLGWKMRVTITKVYKTKCYCCDCNDESAKY